MWGCQPDMLSAGFEYLCMGNLRFTVKGSCEIMVVKAEHLFKLATELSARLSKPMAAYSDKFTPNDLVEKILLHDMNPEGLAVAAELGMKAYRATVGAGTVMFVPAGYAVVERALGSDAVSGFRTHIIDGPEVLDAVTVVEEALLKFTSAEKNPVLLMFATARAALQKAGHGKTDKKDAANK